MDHRYMPEGYSKVKSSGYTVSYLRSARDRGEILEAPAIKSTKELDLIIDLGTGLVGVIPLDEFEIHLNDKPTKSIAVLSRVGKLTQFKVKSISEGVNGPEIILSRADAQQDCYNNFISQLKPGEVISAMATCVEKYGVFCDIGCGYTALLPIEMFCTTRISNPKEDLKGISRLKVVVASVEDGKVTVSHKELLGTWEQEASKFSAGETVLGTVRSVEEYGIFVEMTHNLVGLAEKYPDVEPGDVVKVYIKSIMPSKMKVKLVIIGKADEVNQVVHFDYRLPENGFISDWVYSTLDSSKKLESHFG